LATAQYEYVLDSTPAKLRRRPLAIAVHLPAPHLTDGAPLTGKTSVEKALAYVLNDAGELLVFRHVDFSFEQVGIEVPGGTIRPGEPPEDAALREAFEETGLPDLAMVRKLGVDVYDISPLRPEVQTRHVFHLKASGDRPDRWFSAENHDGLLPPTRLECFWIPLRNAHVLASGQGALIHQLPVPQRPSTGTERSTHTQSLAWIHRSLLSDRFPVRSLYVGCCAVWAGVCGHVGTTAQARLVRSITCMAVAFMQVTVTVKVL
jgi:8-oxo-dGTP pyrophosphatase MutT (NUDIX family)